MPSSVYAAIPPGKQIHLEYLGDGKQPSYKLRLNADCHDYFVRNILSEPTGPKGPLIASHKRLKEAKAHFTKYLNRRAAEEGSAFPDWLIRFL